VKPSISREERGFHQCYSISKMTELSLSIVARSTCSTALASYSTRSTAVVLAASFTMCGRAAASQAFICVACIFMPAAAAAGRADLLTSRTTPAAVVASLRGQLRCGVQCPKQSGRTEAIRDDDERRPFSREAAPGLPGSARG
jgi:hypothetical protein